MTLDFYKNMPIVKETLLALKEKGDHYDGGWFGFWNLTDSARNEIENRRHQRV